ncbi:molecular chaperone DnaJ [Pendulispora albinea]|uniref:Chaperone protein DnaJ n=1 Tax=Pendulispora albinea TaxID=2741071 RepID=A0ABZ2LN82_9BACT
MSKRCYYEVLGVSKDASADELRRAYKKEALKHHPDRNQGNPRAEALFKEVNEAYQVLSDEQKRRIYDQFGFAGLEGGGPASPGDMGDVFSHMQDLFTEMFSGGGPFGFGGNRQPRRGGDLRVQQRLTLREAAFGCKREVVVHAPSRCDDCGGSGGAAGSKPETCSGCRGTGQVSTARGFVMFTAPCARCQGRGQVIRNVCKTCKGEGMVAKPRKVTVNFPAGIDSGQRLRVQGQGMPGPGNVPAGDLYVEIDVEDDPRFERDGTDLVTRVNVGFVEAALGADVMVPSIGPETDSADDTGPASAKSTLTVTIPAGTQSGAVFTLKGQGIPRLDGRGRGCLIVVVQVQVPTALTARARELLELLDEELRVGADADAEGVSRRRVAASK